MKTLVMVSRSSQRISQSSICRQSWSICRGTEYGTKKS